MATPNLVSDQQANRTMTRESEPSIFGREPEFPLLAPQSHSRPRRIAVIGNHLPRQCGIATFTTDLCNAIATECGTSGLQVCAVNDSHSSYLYPARVRSEIAEGDPSSYRETADLLNGRNVDLVCLQHEYGIFGGKAGSHVLELLGRLTMPVVTTLHTVLSHPDADQRSVMEPIAARSARLIVMSEYSSRVLQDVFGVSAGKIDHVPHGIPNLPFVEPDVYKDALALAGKKVLLTFGLLSTNKGFESVIQALPRILARHRNAVYIIAGATHPHVRAREGDRYRDRSEEHTSELQ